MNTQNPINPTRSIRKVLLTIEPDCFGLGDSSLIQRDLFDPLTDKVIEETEEDLLNFLAPYFNKEVLIMNDGNVYTDQGEFLGQEYS